MISRRRFGDDVDLVAASGGAGRTFQLLGWPGGQTVVTDLVPRSAAQRDMAEAASHRCVPVADDRYRTSQRAAGWVSLLAAVTTIRKCTR